MENILRINECGFNIEEYPTYAGYEIVTDQQTIKMGIETGNQCCEDWGYLMSEDNFDDFIGAEIIDITLTDTCLNTQKLETHSEMIITDISDLMFVNINTNKGTLQFVAYNNHNGYYGHDAIVISTQLDHSETL